MPSLPAMVEVLAEGRFDAGPRHRPGPGRRDRGADRPDHGAAGARQLAHRARRLRRACAPASPELEQACRHGPLALLPAVRSGCSRRARPATSRSPRSGSSAARIGRWGRGVDTSRFDPALRDADAYPGRDQGALRRAADQGEGRRAARRLLPPRPRRRPAAAPAARRRRARRRRCCASGSATARRSSAGSAATSCRAPTRAPTSSSSAAAPTPSARCWSRPGPAGCRSVAVDEGGPSSIVVDGETGRLCEPDAGHARRGAAAARRLARLARQARPPGARGRPGAHLGGGDGRSSPTATTGSTEPAEQPRVKLAAPGQQPSHDAGARR